MLNAKKAKNRKKQDEWDTKWPWHNHNTETQLITCTYCIEYMKEHSHEELSRYKAKGGVSGLSAFLTGKPKARVN